MNLAWEVLLNLGMINDVGLNSVKDSLFLVMTNSLADLSINVLVETSIMKTKPSGMDLVTLGTVNYELRPTREIINIP